MKRTRHYVPGYELSSFGLETCLGHTAHGIRPALKRNGCGKMVAGLKPGAPTGGLETYMGEAHGTRHTAHG